MVRYWVSVSRNDNVMITSWPDKRRDHGFWIFLSYKDRKLLRLGLKIEFNSCIWAYRTIRTTINFDCWPNFYIFALILHGLKISFQPIVKFFWRSHDRRIFRGSYIFFMESSFFKWLENIFSSESHISQHYNITQYLLCTIILTALYFNLWIW